MLEGGVIPRRPYLIVGPSGTGKSTLALEFLCEGVRRGERSLLVTVEEPPNEARMNHRGLGPEFEQVEVFDAIPDVMRYERVPFKDISAVRSATPFSRVPYVIRRTPELTGVEVTITGLEQMLRSEVARRGYSRIVIDSLTALQYFCMKGFNEVAGAQTFLRFLSDLQVTTLLTVESPLEDVDTTERMLARGEIRLFRWELDGATVRAVGVEKFRGGSHDVRLHPYRIGPHGLDINVERTISRDTRQIVEPEPIVTVRVPATLGSPLDPLLDEVQDLVTVGADTTALRAAVEAAAAAVATNDPDVVSAQIARVSALAMDLATAVRASASPSDPSVADAIKRVIERTESARSGVAPTDLPPLPTVSGQLEKVRAILRTVPAAPRAVAPPPVPPAPRAAPPPAIVVPPPAPMSAVPPPAPTLVVVPPPAEPFPVAVPVARAPSATDAIPSAASPAPPPASTAPPRALGTPADLGPPPAHPMAPPAPVTPVPPAPAQDAGPRSSSPTEPPPGPAEPEPRGSIQAEPLAGAPPGPAPVSVGAEEIARAAGPSRVESPVEPAAGPAALPVAAGPPLEVPVAPPPPPSPSPPASVTAPASAAPVLEVPSGPPPPFPTRVAPPPPAPSVRPPASAPPAARRRPLPPEPPRIPSAIGGSPGRTGAARRPDSGAARPTSGAPGPATSRAAGAPPPPLPTTIVAAPSPAPAAPPATAPPSVSRPTVPPAATARPAVAKAPPPSLPVPAIEAAPSTPPGAETARESEPVPTKRKAKRPAKAARKGAARTEPGTPETAPALSVGSAAPSLPAEAPSLPPSEPPAPAKPRRRAVRKRKAPPVISATPGPIPPGVLGTAAAPPAAPDEPPTSEGE